MKRWKVWLWFLLPLSACDIDLSGIDVDCNVDRDFSDFISVSGADRLRVIADAGDLRIEGRTGLSEVRVRGDGCAERRSDLDDIELLVDRSGSTVRVLSVVPGSTTSMRARLDLVIEVPSWMLVEIDHDAGNIDVEGVAGVDLLDDTGQIWLEDIFGDVFVVDGSGDLIARNVDGDLVVFEDGSGDIQVSDIFGDFVVESDTSGRISFSNVRGRVSIPR